ncbi:MAG: flagellar hook-length control protein FliK [Bacillota bacterium]|nr:flagellar hook-length control protein FliK [Bacillota bacterium]
MNVGSLSTTSSLISTVDKSITTEKASDSSFNSALKKATVSQDDNSKTPKDSESLNCDKKQDDEKAEISTDTVQNENKNTADVKDQNSNDDKNVKDTKKEIGAANASKKAEKIEAFTNDILPNNKKDILSNIKDGKIDARVDFSALMNNMTTDGKNVDLKTLINTLKSMNSNEQTTDLADKLKKSIKNEELPDLSTKDDGKKSNINLEQLLLALSQAITQCLNTNQLDKNNDNIANKNDVITNIVQKLTNIIKDSLTKASTNNNGDAKSFNLNALAIQDTLDNQIKKILDEQFTQMQPEDKDKLAEQLKSLVQNAIKETNAKVDSSDTTLVKTAGLNQLNAILKDKRPQLQEESNNSVGDKFPVKQVNTKQEVTQVVSNQPTGKESSKNEESKEDKFLKSLLSSTDNSDKKSEINKAVQFISQQSSELNKVNIAVDAVDTTINKNNLTNDVIKVVKYMEINNMKELTVRLVPKELGEVVIKLTMENGIMRANITANNKETYQLLSAHLSEINNQLGNQGNVIQNVSINIYQGDTTFFSGEFNRQGKEQNENGKNSSSQLKLEEIDDVTSKEENIYDDSNINILA